MPTSLPIPDVLTVYGADWCSDCRNTRRFLDRERVPYRYVDVVADPTAQALLEAAGLRAIPVVVTPDGVVMMEPSTSELARSVGIG